jgi:hypothetical protein
MSMTHEQIIAVVQAHKAGKTIQFRRSDSRDYPWEDSIDLIERTSFNFSMLDYRVKPEPREWILVKNTSCSCGNVIDGHSGWHVYNTDCGTSHYPTIKVREVLE